MCYPKDLNMEIKVGSLDEGLMVLAKGLKDYGVKRETRGTVSYEIPEPVTMILSDPSRRVVNNPARKWNPYLGFAETLWILNGVNELTVPGSVVKNLYNFSDDGRYMRAGYGPRLRGFNTLSSDYKRHEPGSGGGIDQLEFIIGLLRNDNNSRQAGITIHDPNKDTDRITKDIPCTRLLQFQIVDGKLDLTVFLRSNDLIWGLSAVNVFNFTMIQEVVSLLVGVPMGKYIHIANNLHIYHDHIKMLDEIIDSYNPTIESYHYDGCKLSYNDFMNELKLAFVIIENGIENGFTSEKQFKHPLIDDLFIGINNKFRKNKRRFHNPIFNGLYNNKR